jgi:phosphate-selective porin OprO and OprP
MDMRLVVCLLVGISLAILPALLRGQDAPDPLAELRQRLDNLERENRELKSVVAERLSGTDSPTVRPHLIDPISFEASGASDARVRSVVEDYLAERGVQLATAESALEVAPDANSGDPPGTVVGQDLTMTATWKNGVEVATKDKAFRYHVGGRWQFDTSWFSADQSVQNNLPGGVQYHDGVDFRRARVRIDGTMYEVMEFAFEYDFVNSQRARNGGNTDVTDFSVPALTDLWLQFSHTPLGNIRVGNQKEAIGFEHMVSSRYLPFMERSYNQDTFYGGSYNGFTPGASAAGNFWEDRASYNVGIYKPTNNVFGFSTNDGDYSVTGRLTWLPVYEDEGRQLVHLGISARQATTYGGLIRFRTRDAIRAGPSVQWPLPADITVRGDRMQWINAEFCALNGPWTLQAEWLTSFTSNAQPINGSGGPRVDSLFYQGGYVQLLYFLTGESDTYSLERMSLDRMKPAENYFWVRGADGNLFGKGAWQVGARYDFLDLNDQGINGGILHNLTAGLNWFLNPNNKVQFNYIATFRDVSQTTSFPNGSGWIHGWGMRFAQDF